MTESLDWDALWDEDEKRYRVQTRDGREVRIWVLDALSDARGPVWGEICSHDGLWFVQSWYKTGSVFPKSNPSTNNCLIPEPRTVRRRWGPVNAHDNGVMRLYGSSRAAKANWPEHKIAEVTWEE